MNSARFSRFYAFAITATALLGTYASSQAQVLPVQHSSAVSDAADTRQPADDFVAPEVVSLYNILASVTLPEQRTLLRDVSPDVKAALWLYNLREFEKNNPQLTHEQRSIVAEGIVLVSTPHWFDSVPLAARDKYYKERLQAHKTRIATAFKRDSIYGAFIKLGGGAAMGLESEPASPEINSHDRTAVTPESGLPPCNCADWYDCDWFVLRICGGPSDSCFTIYRCGFYGNDACIGQCGWMQT